MKNDVEAHTPTIKNCVIRTYGRGHLDATYELKQKLEDGWVVKMHTLFADSNGRAEFIEYILEKEF